MSVLSSARNQRDSDLAEKIFNRMKQLFADQREQLESAQILVVNTFASSGRSSQAEQIRLKFDRDQPKKKVAISMTVVDNQIWVSR